MPLVVLGWSDLWKNFLENSEPQITVTEVPRGIGLVPSVLSFTVSDVGAGLDGVLVRLHQKGHFFDLHKESFERDSNGEVSLTLSSETKQLKEGAVLVEIKAFDKSFWSNTAVKEMKLRVDFRKPEIKVLTTQHNIQRGGSQLVLYEATDQNLGFHGVKVGSDTYLGVPARSFDLSFQNTNVYAAFFSVGMTDSKKPNVRVFAEDLAGNGSSEKFYHKILETPVRPERVKVSLDFLTSKSVQLYQENLAVMQEWAREVGLKEPGPLGRVTQDVAVSVFQFVNQSLRDWSNLEIERMLADQRADKLWDGPFLPVTGTVRSAFGRKVFFDFNGKTIDTTLQNGYEISSSKGVRSVNKGIVLFVKDIGIYGLTVCLDHGVGIYSLYSFLGEVDVSVGEEVEAGQVIASAGSTGFSRKGSYLVQMRIGKKAVNPREWWDKSWYFNHIVEKVNRVKRDLGMAEVGNRL